MLKRALACTLVLVLLLPMAALAADGIDPCYTYNFDFFGDVRQSPDAYRTKAVITSAMLNLKKGMSSPQGLFVRNDDLYICDTGNNRILQVHEENGRFTLTREITAFTGDIAPLTFSSPQDVFVSERGELFICDTNNNRIVKLDADLNLQMAVYKPLDNTFDQSISFLPSKLVGDTIGRMFVIGKNVNKGLIKFEADGTFAGFIGANAVKNTWYEYIWKLLSTKEQRAQQMSFVPTEYDNVAIDEKGFFYVVTRTFADDELLDGRAKPIRRLNAVGGNILVENGEYWPVGDVQWADPEGNITNSGPSKFIDITALENEIYIALDSTHNRLFGYDQQGNMLWAFGGVGNMDGYFVRPVAIEHMGHDLLVLDQTDASVTVMTPTRYGELIYTAIGEYRKGQYQQSADTWRQVLTYNANSDLAFIGVGRALLQQEQYAEALSYFKQARDEMNYSEAWRFYRKQWVEDNIAWVFAAVFALLLIPPVLRRVRKIKQEVEQA